MCGVGGGLWFGFAAAPAHAANVTISSATPFATADASDGLSDGTFNVTGDLLITGTGSIVYNDNTTDCPGPGGGNFSACPIKIHVTGDLVMQAGAKITAENLVNGGNGGDITITVDGDMLMCGPAGAQAVVVGRPGIRAP